MSKNNDVAFENHLTWSSARFKLLFPCEKRYYYQYIGSWGGWDFKAPPEVQLAYHLKYLTTPELELGLLIHEVIKEIFEDARAGRHYPVANLVSTAKLKLKVFLGISAGRKLHSVSRTKRKLLAHESGELITKDEEKFLMDRVESLLGGFYQFPDVQELLKYPNDLLPRFLDQSSFEIGNELGVPARLRTDAVWVTLQSLVIADWKCGRASASHRNQALTYDLYVRKKLNLPETERIEVRFYYLASKEMVSYEFTEEERKERLWEIGEEFATLCSYSESPEINLASPSRFKARVSKACQECPFHFICPDYAKVYGAHPKRKELA